MSTLEATAPETEAPVEQPTKSGIFEVGIALGRTDKLPEFSGLWRCDAGCNTPSAALILRTEENTAPLGFCGHHFRKHKAALDVDSLYAIVVKKGEDSLSTVKGSRAGYLDT